MAASSLRQGEIEMEDVGRSSRQDDPLTGEGSHEYAAGDTEAGDTRMDPILYKYATTFKSLTVISSLYYMSCYRRKFLQAMITGNFDEVLRAMPIPDIPEQMARLVQSSEDKVSTRGNTVLHLAASTGNVQLIELITRKFPGLVHKQNDDGELPLHVAASAGHLFAVHCLVHRAQRNTFNEGDRRGNTALHVAVENNHQDVAMFLVSKDDGSTSHSTNNSSKTPLGMAAETANLDLVTAMVTKTPDSTANANFWQGSKGNSILRAAIIWRKKAIGGYTDETGEDFLPSFLALSIGIYPIPLMAVSTLWGLVQILVQIIVSKQLLVTHRTKYTILLETILSKMDSPLINSTDQEWMSPLTLAAYTGMTALDLAEKTEVDITMSFRRKLTLMALKLANAPRSEERTAKKAKLVEDSVLKSLPSSDNLMFSEESVNTLLLVSTLAVGITFAHGFTIPGGYNSSGNDEGAPVFLTHILFKIFLICNNMAMYGALTASVALMWTRTYDPNIIYPAMKFTLTVLGVTLTMMSLSFTAGVALIVHNLLWLCIVVIAMGLFFTAFIIWILAPLVDFHPNIFIFRTLMIVSRYNLDDDRSNRWSL